jgi:hypothetical protein
MTNFRITMHAELHILNLIQKPRIGEFLGKKLLFVIHADRLCFSV